MPEANWWTTTILSGRFLDDLLDVVPAHAAEIHVWDLAGRYGVLGVYREVDVGAFREREERVDLVGEGARPDLEVQQQERPVLLGEPGVPLDGLVRHPGEVDAVRAGFALGDGRDQLDRGYRRARGIHRRVRRSLLLQPRHHFLRPALAEHAYVLRLRRAVIRHDPVLL
jgi:hypothetical protein